MRILSAEPRLLRYHSQSCRITTLRRNHPARNPSKSSYHNVRRLGTQHGSVRKKRLQCNAERTPVFLRYGVDVATSQIRQQHATAVARDSVVFEQDSPIQGSPVSRTQLTQAHGLAECLRDEHSNAFAVEQYRQHIDDSQRFNILDLLNPRKFIPMIAEFLKSQQLIASFETSDSANSILPKLASRLGLTLCTIQPRHLLYNGSTFYNTHLIKTGSTSTSLDATATLDIHRTLKFHPYDNSFDELLDKFIADTPEYERFEHYDQILSIACRGYAKSMPSLSLSLSDASSERFELAIKNDNYGITIQSEIEPTPERLQTSLTDALMEYARQVRKASEADDAPGIRFNQSTWDPAEFLSRAASALSWGNITCKEELISEFTSEGYARDIWKVESCIAKRACFADPVVWFGRKKTRQLSLMRACLQIQPYLEAAYESRELLPREYQSFARHWAGPVLLASQVGTPSRDLTPMIAEKMYIDKNLVARMLTTLRDLREANFESSKDWLPADKSFEHCSRIVTGTRMVRYTCPRVARNSLLEEQRLALPIVNPSISSRVAKAIRENDITIIKAATGSGKTTQVPQFILDSAMNRQSYCNIVCTQPRRVATVAVAKRVAQERSQVLGQEVGYNVRFDERGPSLPNGITYMTSGYLLRFLESDPKATLSRFTHIILDEVHERDIDTDLLLTAFKKRLNNPLPGLARLPKLILMSATIDPDFFQRYFSQGNSSPTISCIEVPGRTYHVDVQMLDNIFPILQEKYPHLIQALLQDTAFQAYWNSQRCGQNPAISAQPVPTPSPGKQASETGDEKDESSIDSPIETLNDYYMPVQLLAMMIGHILKTTTSGDILVFLPGFAEIDQVEQLLLNGYASEVDFLNSKDRRIFKLHSALYETNYEAFEPLSEGGRRIILATNIAETSITLPDVKYVLDTGYSRVTTFDQIHQTESFGTRWISKAEVAQRKGRAGRTQPGHYIATYSRIQYEAMHETQLPELLRSNLESTVLRMQASKVFNSFGEEKGSRLDEPGSMLLTSPSPPDLANINAAADQLRKIHALTGDGLVTAMGMTMSRLPINPTAAKAIMLALVFRCFKPMMIISQVGGDMPILHSPISTTAVTTARKQLALDSDDDRLADTRAFFKYDTAITSGDQAEALALKQKYYIKPDAYHHWARIANQMQHILQYSWNDSRMPEQKVRGEAQIRPVLPETPTHLNKNCDNEDLVKALGLITSGSHLAVWNSKNWRTATHQRIMVTPRSVNHASGRKAVTHQRRKRELGDVLAFTELRVTAQDKYPWAHETTVVPPLTAMLFGESLQLQGDDTLVVNDWLRYKVAVVNDDASFSAASVAKIILEYRKALDRFVALALSSVVLYPHDLKVVRNRKMTVDDFNEFLKEKDHPVKQIMVDSIAEVLKVNGQHYRDRAALRLEVAAFEEAEKAAKLPESENSTQTMQHT